MDDKKILDKLLNNFLTVKAISFYNILLMCANSFKIVKDNSKFILLDPPPIIDKHHNGEIKKEKNEKFRKKPEYFLNVIKRNVSEEILANIYNNIYSVDVRECANIALYINLFEKGISFGVYDPTKNRVVLHSDYSIKLLSKINSNYSRIIEYQDSRFYNASWIITYGIFKLQKQ